MDYRCGIRCPVRRFQRTTAAIDPDFPWANRLRYFSYDRGGKLNSVHGLSGPAMWTLLTFRALPPSRLWRASISSSVRSARGHWIATVVCQAVCAPWVAMPDFMSRRSRAGPSDASKVKTIALQRLEGAQSRLCAGNQPLHLGQQGLQPLILGKPVVFEQSPHFVQSRFGFVDSIELMQGHRLEQCHS